MRIGSLFSGYGGLDLACEQFFDAQTAWHCEYDEAPSKILAHHWPHVPNYRDVTEIDWTTMPAVDILTGGYPCQPFSAAGQRKGADDDRHLWPYVRQAIRHLRPRFTVLENVAGHRSLGFDRVLGDLAEDGMYVRWTSIRASDIGAPHHRERIFILASPADSDSGECDGDERAPRGIPLGREATTGDRVGLPAHAERVGRIGRWAAPEQESGTQSAADRLCSIDWGQYAPAIRRWERVTRPAPAPTELNSNGKPRLNAAFAEWMMGLPAGHVTAVPGISRAHQLKAIGNGVVPQQALAALGSLVSLEVAA